MDKQSIRHVDRQGTPAQIEAIFRAVSSPRAPCVSDGKAGGGIHRSASAAALAGARLSTEAAGMRGTRGIDSQEMV